jgi:hypothetical protein
MMLSNTSHSQLFLINSHSVSSQPTVPHQLPLCLITANCSSSTLTLSHHSQLFLINSHSVSSQPTVPHQLSLCLITANCSSSTPTLSHHSQLFLINSHSVSSMNGRSIFLNTRLRLFVQFNTLHAEYACYKIAPNPYNKHRHNV